MIRLEVNEAVIVEQQQVLEAALSTNPKTQKALQKLIRQVILEARSKVVNSIRFKNGDPRNARQAVRTTVYRRILGANLNIYNSRKAHGTTSYVPTRTLRPGQRGGNRRQRTSRNLDKYEARDRGFILRWLNDGVNDRHIENFRTDERRNTWPSVSKSNKNPNTGNRGSIAARHFFQGAANSALVQSADKLANLIEIELDNILNKK